MWSVHADAQSGSSEPKSDGLHSESGALKLASRIRPPRQRQQRVHNLAHLFQSPWRSVLRGDSPWSIRCPHQPVHLRVDEFGQDADVLSIWQHGSITVRGGPGSSVFPEPRLKVDRRQPVEPATINEEPMDTRQQSTHRMKSVCAGLSPLFSWSSRRQTCTSVGY